MWTECWACYTVCDCTQFLQLKECKDNRYDKCLSRRRQLKKIDINVKHVEGINKIRISLGMEAKMRLVIDYWMEAFVGFWLVRRLVNE
jgi:hypothetical protein